MRSADFGMRSRRECGAGLRFPAFRIPHSALRTQTVRVAFLGWFVDAACPASKQQWPERYPPRNNEHAESPRTMRRVGINLLRANQRERDSENQPASQVSSQCNKEHGGNHGVAHRPKYESTGCPAVQTHAVTLRIML